MSVSAIVSRANLVAGIGDGPGDGGGGGESSTVQR